MNAFHFATFPQQQIRALAVMSIIAHMRIQDFTEQSDAELSSTQSEVWHA